MTADKRKKTGHCRNRTPGNYLAAPPLGMTRFRVLRGFWTQMNKAHSCFKSYWR